MGAHAEHALNAARPDPLAPVSPRTVRALRGRILGWYATEHRSFPWRRTTDPYPVLVSEVMLQQTQASRVTDRFERFMRRFPTAERLAAASDAEVLAEWVGLGYNRRALALRRAAVVVTDEGWPRRPKELERLPGVGPYTARALASLAFEMPVGVVDTNVRRWLVRRFGLDREAAGMRQLQSLADALAGGGPRHRPPAAEIAAWTHATMELGAAVCRARSPRCDACPVASGCPSRGMAVHVRVPRQAPFTGSERAARGALIRALAAEPGHELSREAAARVVPEARVRAPAIASLERDRLLHRHGARLRLGPAEAALKHAPKLDPGPAHVAVATIGP